MQVNYKTYFWDYGCIIRNRLGLNQTAVKGGIIILELSEIQIKLIYFGRFKTFKGIEYKFVKI